MPTKEELRAYGQVLELRRLAEHPGEVAFLDAQPEVDLASIGYKHRPSRQLAPRVKAWVSRRALSLFTLLFILPSLVGCVIFGVVLSDRYESEAQFVVRNRTQALPSALRGLLQTTGIGGASDDTYVVKAFMLSRDAMKVLADKHDLRAAFNLPEADFLSKFPNFYTPNREEGLYRYYKRVVIVGYDQTTGVTTLQVRAFRPEDAHRLTVALLTASEQFVNQMNERANRDTVRVADNEVLRLKDRAFAAQDRLTEYRNQMLLVDPTQAAAPAIESISRLSLEAAQVNMQTMELLKSSPQAPALATLRQRAVAIQQQMEQERGKLVGKGQSLNSKISEYERRVLELEFSSRALSTALGAAEFARVDAARQQVYIEPVSSATTPDHPAGPYRILWSILVMVISYAVYKVTSILVKDTQRHARLRATGSSSALAAQ